MFFFALDDFVKHSEAATFCALLGPRQIGKTTALKHPKNSLIAEGMSVLYCDFKIALFRRLFLKRYSLLF